MIYFIRHGQTDWNVAGKAQGRQDVPLNATGIEQAKQLAPILKNLQIDRYFCSPLQRARQTFRYAVGREPTTEEIDHRITERDFGEFEGLKKSEFNFQKFCDETATQDYVLAETVTDVRNRARDFLEDVNQKYPHKKLAVFSHGGFGHALEAVIAKQSTTPNFTEHLPHGAITAMNNELLK